MDKSAQRSFGIGDTMHKPRRFFSRRCLLSILLATAVMLPNTATAFRTPFGDRVSSAINRGLAWMRTQIENGQYNGVTTAIAGLAFLERRTSRHWNAPTRGYANSTENDKARLRQMAAAVIGNDPALTGEGEPEAYRTGTNLSFLSLYRSTGGPNELGAVVTVSEAIANGVAALLSIQAPADADPCLASSWNYVQPLETGDNSTTQIVAMGLSAALGLVPDALDSLEDITPYLGAAKNEDGGFGYRACRAYVSTTSMTAAAINILRIAGHPGTHQIAQDAMAWLRNNFRYQDHIGGNFPQSYYYALWSNAKAFELMGDEGQVGIWEHQIGGERNPANDGFPEEPVGWYYDFAFTLVNTQDQQGTWPCVAPRACWQTHAATAFAVLVLERSLGGICGDETGDGDGVCQGDDNCPDLPNPDQADADNDGVGNVCDNCPNNANGNQNDSDGDGIGDGCDPYNCIPVGVETCNGRDDDCDESIDEGGPGSGADCNTDQVGQCQPGVTECIFGHLQCTRVTDPSPEECDGLDNNCDGEIDEGRAGGLRPCETELFGECRAGLTRCIDTALTCTPRKAPLPELCDGLDNDCDGQIDEGNPGGELGCNTGDIGACSEGRTRCEGGALLCVRNSNPSLELCDAQDNDCDGQVDEGNPGSGIACVIAGRVGACGDGLTSCQLGVLSCLGALEPNQRAEACNGSDDDCDGQVDESLGAPIGDDCVTPCGTGTLICSLGQIRCNGPTQGSPEFCDGSDNDCDGVIDEDSPGMGQQCLTGADGVCAEGLSACVAGGVTCVGNVTVAERAEFPEACNSIDDDCDGRIDEGNAEGGQECATNAQGVCARGQTRCINGDLACRPENEASDEICDGIDNDCDGRSDEDVIGADVPCDTALPGQCGAGRVLCGVDEETGDTVFQCDPIRNGEPELCDAADNDCDGLVDEGDPGSGRVCDTELRGACSLGEIHCVEGELNCVQQAQATPEICDGIDNDCDGLADEDDQRIGQTCQTAFPGQCEPGIFRCQGGVLICEGDSQAEDEDCDGLDNDCDGQVDENNPGAGLACIVDGGQGACGVGLSRCVDGAIVCGQAAQPAAELCDGQDNDCDGEIDEENPQGGEVCDTGSPGLCGIGTQRCVAGGLFCENVNTPTDEICDGEDNDCDARVDEDDFRGDDACASGEPGRCALGQLICAEGALLCPRDNQPLSEICNAIDDDCDGRIDENLRNRCGVCGPLAVEECNGIDDDCDGQLDEGQLCPGTQVCAVAQCVEACIGNECFGEGLACVDGGCVDPCLALECPLGWACEAGACQDLCTDVECGTGFRCFGGECVSDTCYETGCEGDNICLNGQCQENPCTAIQCDPGSFCRFEGDPPAGRCVPSCADVSCPANEHCVEGLCVEDPCFGVTCPETQTCRNGVCQGNCAGVVCGRSLICFDGRCIDDPCLHVTCPGGERCEPGNGLAHCVPNWTARSDMAIPDLGVNDRGLEADSQPGDAGLADADRTDAISSRRDGSAPSFDARPPPSSRPDSAIADELSQDDSGGCSCDVNGQRPPGDAALLLLFLALGSWWRRPRS